MNWPAMCWIVVLKFHGTYKLVATGFLFVQRAHCEDCQPKFETGLEHAVAAQNWGKHLY
jgi:hypothetical protein